MTMTEAGPGVPVIRIYDKGMPQPVEIHGTRIGFGTSERDDSLKWAEIEIYRQGEGGYMVHRLGYSLVYHRADTWCRTAAGSQPGHPATVDDLPDEASPCRDCKPPAPQRLADDEAIRYEYPRHTFDSCKDAREVVASLTVVRHRDGTPPSIRFSGPVQAALREAAEQDKQIYQILPAAYL
jgi:hypothetical protein